MTGTVLVWVGKSDTIPVPTVPMWQNPWVYLYPWSTLQTTQSSTTANAKACVSLMENSGIYQTSNEQPPAMDPPTICDTYVSTDTVLEMEWRNAYDERKQNFRQGFIEQECMEQSSEAQIQHPMLTMLTTQCPVIHTNVEYSSMSTLTEYETITSGKKSPVQWT